MNPSESFVDKGIRDMLEGVSDYLDEYELDPDAVFDRTKELFYEVEDKITATAQDLLDEGEARQRRMDAECGWEDDSDGDE